MNMSIPEAILISTPTDLILTLAIHMSGSGKIKVLDLYVLSLPPYEHEYSRGNTHIYAYGSHSYLGNTHVRGGEDKSSRLIRAKFTPI